jgi:hypothetical protein
MASNLGVPFRLRPWWKCFAVLLRIGPEIGLGSVWTITICYQRQVMGKSASPGRFPEEPGCLGNPQMLRED